MYYLSLDSEDSNGLEDAAGSESEEHWEELSDMDPDCEMEDVSMSN